ncbi:HD domain-containing protein [Bacillus litorisediminis]|uniref:HD domain-containing protein n=1 Tax=Bacillus litorisediminis TaxID=2922713 RepID=UPI001FAB6E85|nr:HD domain-containing protein [Bacillus litorisediminis]
MIKDPIYGSFELEPVLTDLLQSRPVQRLRGVHQGGSSYLVNPKWNVTRYEHSVGVMLLVKRMGGSIEEQMAALLHDVSHTAFSHVSDFALRNLEEDYHEQIFRRVIEESEIPDILHNYGYTTEQIFNDFSKWTILEQPSPDLCADRIDYTIRDQFHYFDLNIEEIQKLLESLTVQNGLLCFKTLEAAERFTKLYYQEVIDFFMDPLNAYGNWKLSIAIRLGLRKKILKMDDLLKDDQGVWSILQQSKDPDMRQIMRQIHPNVDVVTDEKNYDYSIKNKPRLLDPMVVHNGITVRASAISKVVGKLNETAIERFKRGARIRVVSFYKAE